MMTSLIGHSKRLLVVLAIAAAGAFAHPTYTYLRNFHAAVVSGYQVVIWLNTPVATLPDGKTLVRAQLIDAALEREAAVLNAQWLVKKLTN